MPYTFPQDSAGKAGAVRPTTDGNGFFVPIVMFGPDGTTPLVGSGQSLPMQISGTDIQLPMTITNIQRSFLFTYKTPITASTAWISAIYDMSGSKAITGIVSTDQVGTLYIQESDDQSTWFNSAPISVVAATGTAISDTTYYDGTYFARDLSLRYARLVYVNGGVTQLRFAMEAFSRSL